MASKIIHTFLHHFQLTLFQRQLKFLFCFILTSSPSYPRTSFRPSSTELSWRSNPRNDLFEEDSHLTYFGTSSLDGSSFRHSHMYKKYKVTYHLKRV
eukprot:m.133044 g.133044  ORF g.133044 m.133044 type:complete len:97 (-) comp9490_c0_seq2:754-1044(-)